MTCFTFGCTNPTNFNNTHCEPCRHPTDYILHGFSRVCNTNGCSSEVSLNSRGIYNSHCAWCMSKQLKMYQAQLQMPPGHIPPQQQFAPTQFASARVIPAQFEKNQIHNPYDLRPRCYRCCGEVCMNRYGYPQYYCNGCYQFIKFKVTRCTTCVGVPITRNIVFYPDPVCRSCRARQIK